jgi:chemosensory pili system protein ChpA (sensor histidine kinase/response regulator)
MQLGNTVHFNSFKWVKEELRQLLTDIQRQLETYINAPDDVSKLDEIISLLRQVRGTLSLVEIYGAALLSEEMEMAARALKAGEVSSRENAYEVLLSAAIRLPDYLDGLSAGKKDVPLILLPLLNDLRACRNASLLSENVLFFPDVTVATGNFDQAAKGLLEPKEDPTKLATQLRHQYQLGLLGWFKNENAEEAFDKMYKVAGKLRKASSFDSSSRLWWVSSGIIDALRKNGVEGSVALKSLMGKVDRQMKRLADVGEDEFAKTLPEELTKNLLYYVARAKPVSDIVKKLKSKFKLQQYLPDEEELANAARQLGGPNQELLNKVSEAIREDINQVKDAIEVFTHGKLSDPEPIKKLPHLYAKIADTLGMLGLGRCRENIMHEKSLLDAKLKSNSLPSEENLMATATTLLAVESDLDAYVNRRLEAETGGDSAVVPEQENAAVVASLVNEALKNLALVKDAYLSYVDNPEPETLAAVPVILKELSGAMFVPPLDDITPIINGLNDYFADILIPAGYQPDDSEQDIVADTVTNIECFLEAVAEHRVDAELYVAAGRDAVAKLSAGAHPAAASQPAKGVPKATRQAQPAARAPTVSKSSEIREPTGRQQARSGAPASAKAYKDLQVIGGDTDEEILEIFLEEALEELQRITSLFPAWKSNPGDSEAITTIRRSFHTLKGSGRLIGATMIGEFAWAVENMLNRLIDGTIHESPDVLSIIDESIGVLPQLIEQIRSGNAQPVENMFELMERATQIANKQAGISAANTPGGRADARDIADDEDMGDAQGIDEVVLASLPDSEDELTITPEDLELGEVDDFPRIDRGMIVEELSGADIADEFIFEDDDARPPTSRSARQSALTGRQFKSRDLTGEYLTLTADPALLDIFSDEADAHLTEITRIIDKARVGKMSSKNVEGLVRALHTLHGSARTAKFRLIAEKAGVLEQHANNLAELGKSWQPEELKTLSDAVVYIRNCIAHLKEHTSELSGDEGLDERIRACVDRSEAEMKSARSLRMDKTGYAEKSDLDPELISIFLEEAPDIIESIERELQDWKAGGLKPDKFNEILRQLHTLKGSARMASLGDIGDLSHTLESLFITIATDKLAATPALADVLSAAVDRLVGMLDILAQGRVPAVEPEYLEKLEAIRLGKLDPLAADAAEAESPRTGGVSRTGGAPKTGSQELTTGRKLKIIKPARTAAGAPTAAVEQMAAGVQQDQIRVRSDKLDMMVNYAGEVNIYHSRIGQYINNLTFNLNELEQTVNRLRRQMHDMEAETDAQIASRHEREVINPGEDFDPLEMDRYSHMQQISRAMAESANDLDNLKDMLGDLVRSSEVALQQQSRVSTELQEELLQTRMVRFQGIASRLRRVIRQTAGQLGKKVELEITGEDNEIDRSVQERMIAPLEHMLRNAVFHGVEKPEVRTAVGKPDTGTIRIDISRDGSYIVMNVSDDGQGMDVDRIRNKAIQLGLMTEGEQKSDHDIFQFIMHEGFSTADDVSQIAGRGVGMDVVDTEIKQLGGNLHIESEWGRGTTFSIRLPLTLAINQALLIQLEEDIYAIPLTAIEGVAVLNATEVRENMLGKRKYYEYAGETYDMHYLGLLLGTGLAPVITDERRYPLLMLRGTGRRIGVHVDAMLGRREIVVKPVGPQITTIPGISGATILADGRVALIIDVAGLLRKEAGELTTAATVLRPTTFMKPVEVEPIVMVVDDSITIRKVTARILGRHNLKVVTAKDGLDAIQQLQEVTPDLFLMDIEMPRMDGFELATHVKSDSRLQGIPIIMITSRTGEKHRERARQIGVERYLGKPFQENELMDEINELLDRQSA